MAAKIPPTIRPKERSCLIVVVPCVSLPNSISIKFKLLSPICVLDKRFLSGLIEKAIFQDKNVHLCAHEAAICIFRRTYYRLPSHVERGINENATTRFGFKSFQ